MDEHELVARAADDELTLRLVQAVTQRARLAQRAGTGTGPLGAAPPGDDGREPDLAPSPDPATDPALDADLDRDPGLDPDAVAGTSDLPPPLPHPLDTDANLAIHLGRAQALADLPGLSRLERTALQRLVAEQTRYNSAVVHTLHQLEHRTRRQAGTIAGLEAELAEARRALTALEADGDDRGRPASGGTGGEHPGDVRRRCRIAVLKPDFGARGGFERHVRGLVGGLRGRGWDITVIRLDATTRPDRLFGAPVGPVHRARHDEFFLHLSLVEQVQQLRLDRYDLVVTTQPPTYLADHPRKLAFFYHQPRQFYELAVPFTRSGFAEPELHGTATRGIRALEREAVAGVERWFAGSAEVRDRLRRYWSVPEERIELHHGAPISHPDGEPDPLRPDGPVVCVSRQEWPKRTELVVHAMHRSRSGRVAHLVGGGSRLDYLRFLDERLDRRPELAAGPFRPEDWLHRAHWHHLDPDWRPERYRPSRRVVFDGEVSDAQRDRRYREALAVVAPAYREDYGLTALEAMAWARPVIVCRDGGGLTELVEDGVNGFVVDPDPGAVAEAIDRLADDPALAAKMGAAGRETVAGITVEAELEHFEQTFLEMLGDGSGLRRA